MLGSYSNHSYSVTNKELSHPSLIISSAPNWNDLFLRKELLLALQEMGFHQPSEVQSQAIPRVLQGANVICQAKAGMGKTAVFVIGILNLMTPEANSEYLPHQCIVIAHTRELAYQINKEFIKFSKYMTTPPVRIGCYFGGLSIDRDMGELSDRKTSPHIIIGTPGRLLDLLYRGYINASKTKYFVIDECDITLCRQGMSENVIQIHKHFQGKAQHILVSATITQEVVQIGEKMMGGEYFDIRVDKGILDLKQLHQFYEIVSEKNKFNLLSQLLDNIPFSQAIVFVNKIQRAIRVSQQLDEILFNPITIHSGLSQQQRIDYYDQFKANGSRILVATNLFGRGIDIQRVNLVINYDFPIDKETYLHRIGRAGRFGTRGIVVNFADSKDNIDVNHVKEFEKAMNCNIHRLPKNIELNGYL